MLDKHNLLSYNNGEGAEGKHSNMHITPPSSPSLSTKNQKTERSYNSMIYKPSNLSPNLEEIDVTTSNDFSCQINTAGTTAKAYKLQILNGSGNKVAKDFAPETLDKPISDKGFLTRTISASELAGVVTNGNDYQWNIRTYESNLNSTAQPQTLVCNSYMVGSTTYALWTELDSTVSNTITDDSLVAGNNVTTGMTMSRGNIEDLDLIKYDKYVEFKTTGSTNIMPILEPNTDRITLPGPDDVFTQRIKISWVVNDLGLYNSKTAPSKSGIFYKPITKIELEDKFTYNYKDGTEFQLYQVASDHTERNFYVDPNDNINRGYYVVLFGDSPYIAPSEKTTTWDGTTTGKSKPQGYDYHYIMNQSEEQITLSDTDLLYSTLYITATDSTLITEAYKEVFKDKINRTLYGGVDYGVEIVGEKEEEGEVVQGERLVSIKLANNQSPIYYDPVSKKLAFVKFDSTLVGTDIYVSSFKTGLGSEGKTGLENATNAHAAGWLPDSETVTPEGLICSQRKITGYGEDTGEIRLQQEWVDERIQSKPSYIPVNGDAYLLFEQVTSTGSTTSTYWKEYWNTAVPPVVGGTPQASFKLMQSRLADTQSGKEARLFIQPNINIKTDANNPNEIVFVDLPNKPRVDITKIVGDANQPTILQGEDITFDKLDDSQWLLRWPSKPNGVTWTADMLIPKTNYAVYTDFMDSMPNAIFYARETPNISMQYKNMINTDFSTLYFWMGTTLSYDFEEGDYFELVKDGEPIGDENPIYSARRMKYTEQLELQDGYPELNSLEGAIGYVFRAGGGTPVLQGTVYNADFIYTYSEDPSPTELESMPYQTWRDVTFSAKWNSLNGVLVKYFQYYLYDENKNLIAKSSETYSSEIEWTFRGLQANSGPGMPSTYYIDLVVADQYGKEYVTNGAFKILYTPVQGRITLETAYDCKEEAITILANSPAFARSTNLGSKTTVTKVNNGDIFGSVSIGPNEVLNYTNIITGASIEDEPKIIISENFSMLTSVKITSDFVNSIPVGGESPILSVAHKNPTIADPNNVDVYTLKMGSMVSFYKDANNKISYNTNQFKLHLYKNSEAEPLNWFYNKDTSSFQNYASINQNSDIEFVGATKLRNVLTGAVTVEGGVVNNVRINPSIGEIWEEGIYYILTVPYGQLQPGMYIFDSNKGIVPDYTYEFVWIDNTNDVNLENNSYIDLLVPDIAQVSGQTSGQVNFMTDYSSFPYYTENPSMASIVNAEKFDSAWFVFYMGVNNAGANTVGAAFTDVKNSAGRK